MYITTGVQSSVSQAVEQLVERYQARLREVKQLGKNTVRGCLNDGRQVTAMVMSGGTVKVWELEEAC